MNHKKKSGSCLLDLVIAEIRDMAWGEIEQLAKNADLHPMTVYFWQQGVIGSPRVANVERALEALGYKFSVTRTSVTVSAS